MRNHIAVHPLGAKFYQLGAGFEGTAHNSYQAINGEKINRKLTANELLNTRLITLPRHSVINVFGKSSDTEVHSAENQINLLLKAYVANRVGTAFLIRCLRYIAKANPKSQAVGLLDTLKRNMKNELKKRPVRKQKLPKA